jgi:hypothetical protein
VVDSTSSERVNAHSLRAAIPVFGREVGGISQGAVALSLLRAGPHFLSCNARPCLSASTLPMSAPSNATESAM